MSNILIPKAFYNIKKIPKKDIIFLNNDILNQLHFIAPVNVTPLFISNSNNYFLKLQYETKRFYDTLDILNIDFYNLLNLNVFGPLLICCDNIDTIELKNTCLIPPTVSKKYQLSYKQPLDCFSCWDDNSFPSLSIFNETGNINVNYKGPSKTSYNPTKAAKILTLLCADITVDLKDFFELYKLDIKTTTTSSIPSISLSNLPNLMILDLSSFLCFDHDLITFEQINPNCVVYLNPKLEFIDIQDDTEHKKLPLSRFLFGTKNKKQIIIPIKKMQKILLKVEKIRNKESDTKSIKYNSRLPFHLEQIDVDYLNFANDRNN